MKRRLLPAMACQIQSELLKEQILPFSKFLSLLSISQAAEIHVNSN